MEHRVQSLYLTRNLLVIEAGCYAHRREIRGFELRSLTGGECRRLLSLWAFPSQAQMPTKEIGGSCATNPAKGLSTLRAMNALSTRRGRGAC